MKHTALVLPIVLCCGIGTRLSAQHGSVSLTRRIEFYNPAWSPDGSKLLFESTLDGKFSVYTVRPDGTDLMRLTVDTAESVQPNWSPDGKQIVFSSDRAGGHLDIYVMNADGSGQRRVTSMSGGGGYYQSSYSPDARQIVFQGRADNRETRDRVYVINSDGTGLRQLSDSSVGAEGPRWSADGTITFLQVPYTKRFWSEMGETDMKVSKSGARQMSIRPNGSGLAPAPVIRTAAAADSTLPEDAVPSPDHRRFAYGKTVNGWGGIYIYNSATRSERLVIGGAGAGPVGYLRTATLSALTDTLDTYLSQQGGAIRRGNGSYYVRSLRRAGAERWELTDTWHDSTGRVTARQSTRTMRGSLVTELESVRALGDSATLLVTADRVTAWVVPQGQAPRLFDGPARGDRFAGPIVTAAIAKAKPELGTTFLVPVSSLYGTDPLELRTDSIRVVRRDTLSRGAKRLPVLVLERPNGGQVWVDETTGDAVLSRGSAGSERFWWHIRRGVQPPSP